MAGDEPSPGDLSPGDQPARSEPGSPSWEPYQSPKSSRGGVLWFLRRYAFSITLLLAALGVGTLLYMSPERLSSEAPPSASRSDGAGASADQQYATVSVYSEPTGASVVVDGDTVGATPINQHRLPSGTYLVSVVQEDYAPRDTVMTLAANRSTVYTPQLRPQAPPERAEQAQAPPTTEDFGTDPPPSRPQGAEPASPPASEGDTRASQEQSPRSESPTSTEPDPLVTGRITLRSTPDSVAVSINGYDAGSTPATLTQVAAGTHEITFSRPGYETVTRQVDVQGRDTVAVQASLKALTGRLRVLVRPWGSIFIDGERHAEDADVWYDTELRAGTHTVTARHPALGEKAQSVELAPRDTQSVILDVRQE